MIVWNLTFNCDIHLKLTQMQYGHEDWDKQTNQLTNRDERTDKKYTRHMRSSFHCNANILGSHNSGMPQWIWLVIRLGQDIISSNIFTEFDKDWMKTLWLRDQKLCKCIFFDNNSGMLLDIWLVIEFGRDIMPSNIFKGVYKKRILFSHIPQQFVLRLKLTHSCN